MAHPHSFAPLAKMPRTHTAFWSPQAGFFIIKRSPGRLTNPQAGAAPPAHRPFFFIKRRPGWLLTNPQVGTAPPAHKLFLPRGTPIGPSIPKLVRHPQLTGPIEIEIAFFYKGKSHRDFIGDWGGGIALLE